MPENDNFDKINYYAIISVIIAFLLLCIIYFSIIIHYIKQNYYKHLTNLWIDYFITVSIGIIFTILYLVTLLINKTKRSITLEDLYSNILLISSQGFLLLFFYSTINNTIVDIIESCKNISKIVKFNRVKKRYDLQEITEKFKKIDIMNNKKENKHLCFIIIINTINILLVSFFIIIYTNINIQKNIFSIKHYIYLLGYYHILVLIILIICIFMTSIFKKCLFINKFHINNNFIKKIYNIYFNQIIYYIDILFFKICIDLFVNITITIFSSCSMSTFFSIFILELSIFFYILIGANILLAVDDNNNYKKRGHRNKIIKSKILKVLFKFKYIHFNNNAYSLFLDDYEYFFTCSIEEKNILSELSINFIDKNLINYNENQEYNLDEIKEIDSQVKEDDSDNNKSGDNSEIDIIAEYFIIYKLLYIFFDKNKDKYNSLLKKFKKNGGCFIRNCSLESNSSGKRISKKRNKKLKESDNNINKEEYLLNVDKFKLSEFEIKELNTYLKLKKEDIFTSIQEEEYLEEINKKYKKSKKSNINFIIEALSIIPLLEIFPFYQIKIEDVLKSLNPNNNIDNFKKFLNKSNIMESEKNSNSGSDKKSNNENVKSDSNESGKNTNNENNKTQINNINSQSKKGKDNTYINESESENKSSESSESNCFSSYKCLIMMEIYNKADFINSHEISELTSSFKNYALKLVQNMKYTFLPLLIGIFNIKFLGKNKIIFLYRNPLYFSTSPNSRFSKCTTFNIENADRPKKSKNSIIDIKETEKDNIKLNDADIEEIITILKNDFHFLCKLKFQVLPKMYLFIGLENLGDVKLKNHQLLSESLFVGSPVSPNQFDFSSLLNADMDANISFNNSSKKKDSFSVEYNCYLEKEYIATSVGNKDIKTIKIYMTNFFRYRKNNEEEDKRIGFSSEAHGNYLKLQLLNYLNKSNSFSGDEKDFDSEKRLISLSPIKSNEDVKQFLKSSEDS